MTTVSIIVPVYYNEQSLPHLFSELTRVEQTLAAQDVRFQLIFVDDGSGDGSYGVLVGFKKTRPDTVIVKLARNFGAVQASKTGLRYATGDCFLVLAADLQDPPELISTMLDHWRKGAKFVMCVRSKRSDPFLTKLFARGYYFLLRRLVVDNYPDGGYDLALMDRVMLPYLRDSGKNINPNVFAFWLGFSPVQIPYERQARKHGRSRWTFKKKLKFFLDTMLGFSIIPLRMMSAIGVIVATLSGGFGLFVIFNALLGKYDVPGFATLASLMSFLMGLVITMLGIIGEYLWRIFDQASPRPESVIESVL